MQYPSKYEWIEQGLIHFISVYKKLNIKSVAFPILCSRNGELDPKGVMEIMMRHLSNLDIDVYICESTLVEGKEKEMVENIKQFDLSYLAKEIKLNKTQLDELIKNITNIERFYDILDIPSIGYETYKKLYIYFYNYQPIEKFEQTTLF